MCEKCPLCQSPTTKLMASFVRYVATDEKHMQDYIDGKLTYKDWLAKIKQEIYQND